MCTRGKHKKISNPKTFDTRIFYNQSRYGYLSSKNIKNAKDTDSSLVKNKINAWRLKNNKNPVESTAHTINSKIQEVYDKYTGECKNLQKNICSYEQYDHENIADIDHCNNYSRLISPTLTQIRVPDDCIRQEDNFIEAGNEPAADDVITSGFPADPSNKKWRR